MSPLWQGSAAAHRSASAAVPWTPRGRSLQRRSPSSEGPGGTPGGGFHSGFYLIATGPRTEGAFPSQLGGEKKAEDGPGLLFSALIQRDFALLLFPEKSHSVHNRLMVTDQAKQLKAVEISKAPQCISAPCKPMRFLQQVKKPEGLTLRASLLTIKSFWLISWSVSVIPVKANTKLQF